MVHQPQSGVDERRAEIRRLVERRPDLKLREWPLLMDAAVELQQRADNLEGALIEARNNLASARFTLAQQSEDIDRFVERLDKAEKLLGEQQQVHLNDLATIQSAHQSLIEKDKQIEQMKQMLVQQEVELERLRK
jgi:hypothetical protein